MLQWLVSIGSVLGAAQLTNHLEGGRFGSYFQITSAIWVIGGATGYCLSVYSPRECAKAFQLAFQSDASMEDRAKAAHIFAVAMRACAVIGMLGFVMGLVHVMENLDDPAKLGGGIAVAIISVVYALVAGELVFGTLRARLERDAPPTSSKPSIWTVAALPGGMMAMLGLFFITLYALSRTR